MFPSFGRWTLFALAILTSASVISWPWPRPRSRTWTCLVLPFAVLAFLAIMLWGWGFWPIWIQTKHVTFSYHGYCECLHRINTCLDLDRDLECLESTSIISSSLRADRKLRRFWAACVAAAHIDVDVVAITNVTESLLSLSAEALSSFEFDFEVCPVVVTEVEGVTSSFCFESEFSSPKECINKQVHWYSMQITWCNSNYH